MKAEFIREVIHKTLAGPSCAVIFEVQDGLGKARKSAREVADDLDRLRDVLLRIKE